MLFISTHAPRAGSDGYIMTSQIYPHIFQPTLPVRGATRIIPKCKRATINFNPRSPCGERQARTCTVRCSSWISTHAPRAGSDRVGDMVTGRVSQFQPTLPVRGATWRASMAFLMDSDFNPRSPCGERRALMWRMKTIMRISTHAPRAGSDLQALQTVWRHKNFNPRSPCGERLYGFPHHAHRSVISTHAPRAGSDAACSSRASSSLNFNPRSPCGERPGRAPSTVSSPDFNPRSPCGERRRGTISDTAEDFNFNPRSPCGERRKP